MERESERGREERERETKRKTERGSERERRETDRYRLSHHLDICCDGH